MLTVTHIRHFDAWQSLTAEWSTLVDRCPSATPFQRPEWLLPWWREFGSGDMTVLAFHDEGRLVGLLPAFIHSWQSRRQVTLIGTGVTDYLGLTAEPERAADVRRERARMVSRSERPLGHMRLAGPGCRLAPARPRLPATRRNRAEPARNHRAPA